MTHPADVGFGKAIGLIALFALLGIPMVAFLWEVLNRLMAGHFDPVRIAVAIPVFVLWLFVLRFMARQVQKITA